MKQMIEEAQEEAAVLSQWLGRRVCCRTAAFEDACPVPHRGDIGVIVKRKHRLGDDRVPVDVYYVKWKADRPGSRSVGAVEYLYSSYISARRYELLPE